MTVNIIGDPPKVDRIITGLYSFDRAFGNKAGVIGFPIGTAIEISGPTFCGKSTLVFGLSGMIAAQNKTNIVLADFEGFDPDFLETILEQSKFSGDIQVVQKDKDEETLDTLLDILKKKDYSIGILDSIAAISPVSESTGDLGEANMGRRAKLMAQFSRKAVHQLRFSGKSLFMINHVHPNLGSMGTTTPGGETVKYLSAVRIRMKRKEEFKDQSYAIEGKVVKNRFGYRDKQFYIIMLAGTGIHLGLSAMYDCFLFGLAERGKIVKIDGKSHGYLKTFFEEAHKGNNQVFDPFHELIENAKSNNNIEPADDTEGDLEDTED